MSEEKVNVSKAELLVILEEVREIRKTLEKDLRVSSQGR